MPMRNYSTFIFFVQKIFLEPEEGHMNQNVVLRSDLTKNGGVQANPSAQSIRKILDFAHAYNVMETEMAGQVEMNLN
jgi:hypothetical protein